jgi:dipeptidyl aminopeptidase/acylaminoacyl peptidase
VVYVDPLVSTGLARIRALFPNAQVNVQSASRDRDNFILRVDGPDHPTGTYFHADVTAGKVRQLGSRYPAIATSDVAPVKAFTYAARDGLAIPAYLTLPARTAPEKLPLVVMPHGGPESRDSASFDPWVQFIATRGYAVFQPQFRGSDGYGLEFRQAGRQQWGLKMQDDITDGVKKLIADGTVDPTRVCIFGWSYGGYAAMAGLAFTPELYKCGISGAGVSDIPDMFGHLKRKSFGGWDHAQYWQAVIGDTFADAPRLKATSPINSVKNIRAPLLLMHGKFDTVVPITQSEGMAKALRQAGKAYEYIQLEDDDHWLSYADSEKRALQEIERFLKQHLQ